MKSAKQGTLKLRVYNLILVILLMGIFYNNISAGHTDSSNGEKVCVDGDSVRMRVEPNANSKIIRILYRLDRFEQVAPLPESLKVGKDSGRWFRASYKVCKPPACENTTVTGYVFEPFLGECEETKRKLLAKLQNRQLSLADRLIFRQPFVHERMLPGGKSTEKNNEFGGCCNWISYTTAKFKWRELEKTLRFDIHYKNASAEEQAIREKPERQKKLEQEPATKFICTVTDIAGSADAVKLIFGSGSDLQKCKRFENLAIDYNDLGRESDDFKP